MLKIWGCATVVGSILCAMQAATGPPASALDRRLELTNNTRMAIVEVYIALVGTGRWQQDLLGDDTVPSGSSIELNLNDGTEYCRFDFKAVFDDGTSLVRRDVNLCALQRYAISHRGREE